MRKAPKGNILVSTSERISNTSIGLLCILFVIFLTPILARNMPNVLLLGLMGLFIISVMPRLVHLPKGELFTLSLLALYMGVQLIYKLIGKSSAELYYYFNTVQFFFFIGAIICIYAALTEKQIKVLLLVPVSVMLLTMASNVWLYLKWDNYVTLYQTHKYTTNSVNTPFSFAVLLLGAVFLIAFLNEKRPRCRIVACALLAFCLFFIAVIAQRAIAILLAAAMIPLLLLCQLNDFPGKNLRLKTKIILIAVFLVIIALMCLFYEPILRTVGTMLGSRILKRVEQIILLIKTGDVIRAGGSLLERYHLLMNSWDSFTQSVPNFLFGIGDHRANNYFIGNHSLILDELARYGIVFASLSFWLVARMLQLAKNISSVPKKSKLSRQFHVLIILFVLRAFLGTVYDVSISIVLFIIVPLSFKLIQAAQENGNTQ